MIKKNINDVMKKNFIISKDYQKKHFYSKHWDWFPNNFINIIENNKYWKNFLRNSISCGFNDTFYEEHILHNGKFTEHDYIGWEKRKNLDLKNLVDQYVSDKKEIDYYLEKIEEVFSVCSESFVLKNLCSNTGSPKFLKFALNHQKMSYEINLHDLRTIYYFFQLDKILKYNINSSKTIVEIGGGFGLLATKIKKKYPNTKIILFDLPEVNSIQTYYLMKEFPNAKFLLFEDFLAKGSKVFEEKFDFIILPGECIENINKNKIDYIINIASFMEMKKSTIAYYIKNIERIIKEKGYLFCSNRYMKNNGQELIALKSYNFNDYWKIILSQTCVVNIGTHDLILQKTADTQIPISVLLNTLPPFTKYNLKKK